MKIGVPKEVKNNEARVAMTPVGVERLVRAGHAVYVEIDAGLGSGFLNEQYKEVGARLVHTHEAWAVELVVKVKEPQASEFQYLAKQMVFTFFHLAGVDRSVTESLLKNGTTAIAYESLEDESGRLPILAPMSAVAGNMSVLMGAYYLARFNQGSGMQLGSVLGKSYGKVLVIGDGVVGQHAAKVAAAMGASVTIAGLDEIDWKNKNKSLQLDINFVVSNKENIARQLLGVDLVVGAVLCRGAKATKVVSEEMIKTMEVGSVVVDVSIDQGGCFETSLPTTHSEPVFIKHGVIHYCVANMPGAYPRASTIALTDVTIGYVERLARQGLSALVADKHYRKAVNVCKGNIVIKQVAEELGMPELYKPIERLL